MMVRDEVPAIVWLCDGLIFSAAAEPFKPDIIDYLPVRLSPAVESILAVSESRDLTCALHPLSYRTEARIVRTHVEVSGNYHRQALGIDPVHLRKESLYTFFSCLLALVVKMSVHEVEHLAGPLVFHESPCGSPVVPGIPPGTNLRRSLREPERAPLLERDGAFIVKDGHVLSLMTAVITTDSHTLILIKKIVEKGYLPEESLLKAIRSLEAGKIHLHMTKFDSANMSTEELLDYINLFAEQTKKDEAQPRTAENLSKTIIFSENREGWIYSLYGIWTNKSTIVPVDAACTIDDLIYIIKDCTPSAMWVSSKKKEMAEKAIESCGVSMPVRTIDDYENNDVESLEPAVIQEIAENICIICYTSGTTGEPNSSLP